ncbi:MAG: SOS response-associated peptidase [Bacteroides sp.]|nr:SOS response-associated peptidase [Bacteroides sp.]
MCFYNSLSKKNRELATRYSRKTDVIELAEDILLEEQYRVNAFQNPLYPIVTGSEEIEMAQWGLIPFWVKPKDNSEVERQEAIERAHTIRK